MRKISLVTSTRADYSILKLLIQKLYSDPGIEFDLIVTGTHFSALHGQTVREIQNDGFIRFHALEVKIPDDSPSGAARVMAETLVGMEDLLSKLQPDCLILLGDRFEILACAQAGLLRNIPIAHIHGGESTLGAIDDAIRHSITHMSSLHFPVSEPYRERILRMGIGPERVFNLGAPALELMESIALLSREDLGNQFGSDFISNFALVTYHPVTKEPANEAPRLSSFFSALGDHPDLNYLITLPNMDPHSSLVMDSIRAFKTGNPDRVIVVPSLGATRYYSLMKIAKAVIGNSSSGVIEAPFYGTPSVNVGNRQKGRITGKSVISTTDDKKEILEAIHRALSEEFRSSIADESSPLHKRNTSANILEILKTFPLA